MGEMNERDLEQVSGGKEAVSQEWLNQNCNVCSQHPGCEISLAMKNRAVIRKKRGEDDACPQLKILRHTNGN